MNEAIKVTKQQSHTAHSTMAFSSFDRPIGAPADVAELDYISALHQTDVQGGIRKDGSIQGEDPI